MFVHIDSQTPAKQKRGRDRQQKKMNCGASI